MKNKQQFRGKTVFVAGGSSGLGKEISKALAAQGAHITIFARRQGPLNEARNEILTARQDIEQEVHAVPLDLGNPSQLDTIFRSQARLPDILYCVAGGTSTEIGFIKDIDAADLESCMRKNYFTAAYSAQSILKIWTEDDQKTTTPSSRLRQIVFINSAAAFVGIPGYVAYTCKLSARRKYQAGYPLTSHQASKCAVRGLADTLRMETLRLSSPASTYTIHCAFPSNFITTAFLEEQISKPELTKRIEGTTGTRAELEQRYPSAEQVAQGIIAGVARGDFAICDDSMESGLLFANMIGPSPKRGRGVVDSLLAIVMGLFIWPFLRSRWDKMCKRDRLYSAARDNIDGEAQAVI
ncbi:MAG: hypothetical protein Q9187_004203 [Circinaria calcarea]